MMTAIRPWNTSCATSRSLRVKRRARHAGSMQVTSWRIDPCYGDGNTRNLADLTEQEHMCDQNAEIADDLTGKVLQYESR